MEREKQHLRRRHRLSRSDDFRRTYRKGRRRRGRLANLHYLSHDGASDRARSQRESEARLGITASRKVGGAVTRHRLKRRVREIFRRHPERPSLAGLDLVVHLHPAAADVDFDELRNEIAGQIRRVARDHAAAKRGDDPAAPRGRRGR